MGLTPEEWKEAKYVQAGMGAARKARDWPEETWDYDWEMAIDRAADERGWGGFSYSQIVSKGKNILGEIELPKEYREPKEPESEPDYRNTGNQTPEPEPDTPRTTDNQEPESEPEGGLTPNLPFKIPNLDFDVIPKPLRVIVPVAVILAGIYAVKKVIK